MREVAPIQWDQRGDLRRDDVRWLPRRREGLVPRRQRRAIDAGEDGAMVLDRHRLGRLLVRAARPARDLSSRCENGRLDNVRHQLVAGRKTAG